MALERSEVRITVPEGDLRGALARPPDAQGVVVFIHGAGSGRTSPRNRAVARIFNDAGLATLLFDLLTPAEAEKDALTREYRFDIPRLSERAARVVDWARGHPATADLALGIYGSSTGAAGALNAAAARPEAVRAVVSRGGRPDLALDAIPHVRSPVLLIVGGKDRAVLDLNRVAFIALRTTKALEIIPGATHLFEEPGAMDRVVEFAASWFMEYLTLDPGSRDRRHGIVH